MNDYSTPPAIRVFLSSTFMDMEHERSYFNEILAPKLTRICAQRGVSFFSVDLRWGITQEEQVNDQVLPICLREIDRCRPFFIGILGNHYGTVMEKVPQQISASIPWLSGKEGLSITELEMLYAVLEHTREEQDRSCSFYFRSEDLSSRWYGSAPQGDKLKALKARICSDENIPSSEYDSLEEFGRKVTTDILRWLDQRFPIPEKASETRRQWYNRELLRNYIQLPECQAFLDRYCRESQRSLLIFGDGGRGKTTFLTAWEPAEGHKILINCSSDDKYLYWPSIAKAIIREIREIDPNCGFPETKAYASIMFALFHQAHEEDAPEGGSRWQDTDDFFVTDEELEDFRLAFLQWLHKLSLEQPVCVVINDLNLLEDDTSLLLAWIPSSVSGNVRFICSTNHDEMVNNAAALGWNCKEMPLFSSECVQEFLNNYLNTYGKNLSSCQMDLLLSSAVAPYPGQLRFVSNFLINYGRFDSLDKMVREISGQENILEVYNYAFAYLIKDLSPTAVQAVRTAFGLLRYAAMSLREQECFDLVNRLHSVTIIEWAQMRNIFEQFGLVAGDYWNLRQEELQKFADKLLSEQESASIHELLGDYMLEQLHAVDHDGSPLSAIRECTAYSRLALHQYQSCEQWEKLQTALTDPKVLFYLTKLEWQAARAAWMALHLNSPLNIRETLLTLLEKFKDASGDNRSITIRTAGLFIDLELRDCLDRVYAIMGTDRIPGSLGSDLSSLRPKFVEAYRTMQVMHRTAHPRMLLEYTEKLFASREELQPLELCQLLFFKADSERKLEIFNKTLETANLYYETALKAGYLAEINRALSIRGDALYFLGRYEDAIQIRSRSIRLSRRQGQMRDYLAAMNGLAMCLYRTSEFSRSIEIFDRLITCWTRIGNLVETGSMQINRANALFVQGRCQEALDAIRDFYAQLPEEDPSLGALRLSMLGNMGAYAVELKEYDLAEKYLLETIAGAEKAGQETTLFKARMSLIRVYEHGDRFMKAVDIYQAQMELLWRRKEYSLLADMLKRACELLIHNSYHTQARELEAQWRNQFSQLQNGEPPPASQMHKTHTDSKRMDALSQQLAISKSEGNTQKIADAYRQLSKEAAVSDPIQGLEYMLEAADTLRAAGEEAYCARCLEEALPLLFDKGRLRSPEKYHQVRQLLHDPDMVKLIDLWVQLGCFSESEDTTLHGQIFADLLGRLPELASRHPVPVTCCLLDIVHQISHRCSTEEFLSLVESLPQKVVESLREPMQAAMLETYEQDFSALIRDYSSDHALEKLAFYEKCVAFLTAIKAPNAGALAGNIALIFRRRKDREKTLHYHRRSMESYQKAGQKTDYLIELMNTSSAFREFGDIPQAISLLRQGLGEAAAAGEKKLEASIAGNLASLLSKVAQPDLHTEIMDCFAIEEKFFRSSDSQRDLAISLLNQVIYLKDRGDTQAWERKLEDATRIVRTNHFQEFESTLEKLEREKQQIGQARQNGQSGSAAPDNLNVEELIRHLLSQNDLYEMEKIVQEQDAYHAFCRPKGGEEFGQEQLHIFLPPTRPLHLEVNFLFRPRLYTERAIPEVRKYVDWWNGQNRYSLKFHEQDSVLQGCLFLPIASREKAASEFSRLSKQWETDKSLLGGLFLGLLDASACKDVKLKRTNESS